MLRLQIKDYRVHIASPAFHPYDYSEDTSYFEVFLTIIKNDIEYYVDLSKQNYFKILLDLDDRNMPKENITDMAEYNAFLARKSCQMPSYKLSRKNTELLLNKYLQEN